MRLLVDTHLLLWAAGVPERLPPAVRAMITDPANDLFFSAASIWEVAIKNGLRRPDFRVDPRLFRRGLLAAGYGELAITGAHAAGIDGLTAIHKDPFDRMLVAQAMVEDVTLITSDPTVARYPGVMGLMSP